MQWRVEMTPESESKLISDFRSGDISKLDVIIIKQWVAEMEDKGLEPTQRNANWRDHRLYGRWFGQRAISFSYEGRLIYRVEKISRVILVVHVTHNHNY